MNLDEVVGMQTHVETHDQGRDHAGDELERPRGMRIDLHVDRLAAPRTGADGSRGATAARDGGYAPHRPERVNQGGQVVRPHVEERSTSGLVVECRVGMPGLMAQSHHECRGGNRCADGAGVDQTANRLMATAQEGVRRTAHAKAGGIRRFEHAFTFRNVEAEGLLAVGVFASLDSGKVHRGVGSRNREVQDDFHVIAPEQFVPPTLPAHRISFPCDGLPTDRCPRNRRNAGRRTWRRH